MWLKFVFNISSVGNVSALRVIVSNMSIYWGFLSKLGKLLSLVHMWAIKFQGILNFLVQRNILRLTYSLAKLLLIDSLYGIFINVSIVDDISREIFFFFNKPCHLELTGQDRSDILSCAPLCCET